MAAASVAEPAASGPRLRRTYSSMWAGEDLDEEYGSVTGGASKDRRAGVIIHPTSLPGPHGIGEIGEEAFKLVDWLVSAGLSMWQVLPLVPPEEEFWSPYTGLDALCGSTLMISLDELVKEGLLDTADLPDLVEAHLPADFFKVKDVKEKLLRKAADRLRQGDKFQQMREEAADFRQQNPWVEDSALFYALSHYEEGLVDKAWWFWPEPIRFREKKAMAEAKEKFKDEIERFIALQYIFDKQWKAVRAYANSKGVKIVGDIPIYVGGQSADVWAYQDLFELGADGQPLMVSGVPPDAFSETGQLWGSPLYDWKAHKEDGFRWWVQRLSRCFQLHDEVRIDHFRGFAGYYAVDAKAETAMDGVWKKGPGVDLFNALEKELGHAPIIAEDLGVITADVVELRENIAAPGMVVLQFAWGGGATNVHLPHNHYENSVVYPGTHDNETALGWWKDSATDVDREYLLKYLHTDGSDIAWLFIRSAFSSVSHTAIVLMQDIMRLDNSARMNLPGSTTNNWTWRIGGPDIWDKLAPEAAALKELAQTYDRLPEEPVEAAQASIVSA